jgi:hypothetical protein
MSNHVVFMAESNPSLIVILKSEIRNNIEIQIFKIRNSPKLSWSGKTPLALGRSGFGHWRFVLGFDIRISYFANDIMSDRFPGHGAVRVGKRRLP